MAQFLTKRSPHGVGEFLRIAGVILFLALSFWHLDRFPEIHNDEVGIIEPGYNWFSTGVYGSRMYTGYYERERIYLEIMPAMPLLQGFIAKCLGVGVLQMRLIPVIVGAIILLLTEKIGTDLTANKKVGLLSAFLMMFWQVMPAGENAFLGSGIPLIDITRIARYDTVATAFGLVAFWFWLKHRKTGKLQFAIFAGAAVGLAGLTHPFGLIWLIIFWGLQAFEFPKGGWKNSFGQKHFWVMNFAVGATCLPWVIVIVKNWALFTKQFLQRHQTRMGFLDMSFYWHNLSTEFQRFHLGVSEADTFLRIGFWLFVLGIPAGMGWLAWRAFRRHDPSALRLFVPILLFSGILALLDQEKRVYYLLVYFPLLAILLAWGISQFKTRLVYGGLLLVFVQGVFGIGQLHIEAAHRTSPDEFFTHLREAVPPSGVIIGPQTLWLAFPERDYRSIIAPTLIALSDPDLQGAFLPSLERLGPDILLVHPSWKTWVTNPDNPAQGEEAFWAFMDRHQAMLITTLPDQFGFPVEIYALRENTKHHAPPTDAGSSPQ